MRKLDNYLKAPGHCRLCTGCVTPIIDTERSYDSDGYGGELYVCSNCVHEMARIMGYVDGLTLDTAVDENQALIDDTIRLNERISELEAELELYAKLKELARAADEVPVKRAPGRPRKTV